MANENKKEEKQAETFEEFEEKLKTTLIDNAREELGMGEPAAKASSTTTEGATSPSGAADAGPTSAAGPAPAAEAKKERPIEISPALITVTEDGKMVPKDHLQLHRIVTELFRGNAFPKHLDNIPKAMMAWQLAIALKLEPLLGVKNIAIINGSPALFGDLPKGLCQATGELEVCREYLIDKDYKEISFANRNLDSPFIAAICEIKRKGKEARTYHFTVAEAKHAGIWDKNVWKPYPQTMIIRRARSIALKTEFPDVTGGVNIAEYDFNATVTEDGKVHEPRNVASEINKAYLDSEEPSNAQTPEVLPAESAS